MEGIFSEISARNVVFNLRIVEGGASYESIGRFLLFYVDARVSTVNTHASDIEFNFYSGPRP